MNARFSKSKVLKDLKKGPNSSSPPETAHLVATAASHPKQFANVLSKLFYSMVDEQFRYPHKNIVSRYSEFSRGWHGALRDDVSRFYLASLGVYSKAVSVGFRELDWKAEAQAEQIADAIVEELPSQNSVEGLAWRCLLGQVQSIYSRELAAKTFGEVRRHSQSSLASLFTRNVGVFSYFSEEEVANARRDLPTLNEMRSWVSGSGPSADQAIVVSMAPHFFRIYAPMILFNAQQLPNIDFVLLINASSVKAQELHMEAHDYLRALSALNRQAVPKNVRFHAVQPPSWVANERTFYACSRFIVLPDLLEEYVNLYAIDADLFLLRNPETFLEKVKSSSFGVPRTEGLQGVPPWRRYMAGNVVVNRQVIGSSVLRKIHDYLSVGLSKPVSWTLDQNALCFAIEGATDEYQPIRTARPVSVGNVMGQWERNYKDSIR